MMFGTRDEFDYLECPKCRTVQIAEIPDLTNYYPPTYYSYTDTSSAGIKRSLSAVATKAFFALRKFAFTDRLFTLGRLDARLIDRGLGLKSVLSIDPPFEARILDVGCGSGELLRVLKRLGYRSLTGIDKYLRADLVENGLTLRAAEITEIEQEYDLVMFHHSLEHLPDPRSALQAANRILVTGGKCLVRIPLLSYSWEKYGVNWVGLDAPRHLLLMTEATVRTVATDCGFSVTDVSYDSTEFQFWGSEKYSLDIPLLEGSDEVFSRRQLRKWNKEAKRLNRERRGDQAAFILEKK